MTLTVPLILAMVAGLLTLLVLLAGLISLRRVRRSINERRAYARRDGFAVLLAEADLDTLTDLARRACRSRAVRGDLVRCARRELHTLPPERADLLARAATAAGLDDWARSSLQARSPVKRGNAVVLGSRVVPLPARDLEPLLKDPDGDVRLATADALALIQNPEAAWALVNALPGDAVDNDRIVERLAGPWALDVVLEACGRREYEEVRPSLCETLGLTGDERAVDTLLAIAASGSDEERVRAARALGAIGSPTATDTLIGALDDEFWAVRAQAARGLGLITARSAIERLVGRMGDTSWWVRANCADALRAIGEDGIEALRVCADTNPDRYARQRAAEALAMEAALRGAEAGA
jgi:HEAT repeat protein